MLTEKRLEEIIRDNFYNGPMGGSTKRLLDAIMLELYPPEIPKCGCGETKNLIWYGGSIPWQCGKRECVPF